MGVMNMGVRTRRAGGARRDGILDAVIDVLADRGYDHTRFTDVSAATGVPVSTLQNYFGSREDMLIEALRRAVDREVVTMEAVAAAEEDPWTCLVALVRHGLRNSLAADRMLLEFWRAAMRDEELRAYTAALRDRYREPFVTAVAEGCRTGAFRARHEPDDIVDVLVVCLGGAVLPRVHQQPTVLDEGFESVLLAQLADSLQVEAPGRT